MLKLRRALSATTHDCVWTNISPSMPHRIDTLRAGNSRSPEWSTSCTAPTARWSDEGSNVDRGSSAVDGCSTSLRPRSEPGFLGFTGGAARGRARQEGDRNLTAATREGRTRVVSVRPGKRRAAVHLPGVAWSATGERRISRRRRDGFGTRYTRTLGTVRPATDPDRANRVELDLLGAYSTRSYWRASTAVNFYRVGGAPLDVFLHAQ